MKKFINLLRITFAENPLSAAALVLFILFLLVAVLGPLLVPYDPLASDETVALLPPSATHWFGMDQLGRDIFSRVIVGVQMDLFIALGSVVMAATLGTTIGLCAGYFGGMFEKLTGRSMDMLMAFPLFVLAMAIVAALGNTVTNIVLASAIINLPFYVRLARSEVSVLREAGFVQSACLCGAGSGQAGYESAMPAHLPMTESTATEWQGLPFNLEEAEKVLIERALQVCNGNVSAAARMLGVNRAKLYRR